MTITIDRTTSAVAMSGGTALSFGPAVAGAPIAATVQPLCGVGAYVRRPWMTAKAAAGPVAADGHGDLSGYAGIRTSFIAATSTTFENDPIRLGSRPCRRPV